MSSVLRIIRVLITRDPNWSGRRQLFCVVQCDDVKVLYYREHEIRGVTRAQWRIVPKEGLWDTLETAHTELSHEGLDRMHAYFLAHNYHIP